MITDHNIPKHAIRTEYEADRHVGVYYVWRQADKWYWVAAGNQGEEATEALASQSARRWIRDGC